MLHNTTEAVRAEYTERLGKRQNEFADLERMHRQFGSARVALFAITVLLCWQVFGASSLSLAWIALPVVAFIVIAVKHDSVVSRLARVRAAVSLYKLALLRLDGVWYGRGSAGIRFRTADHPYSEDLDLFGFGSLFELLCCANTKSGEGKLAGWLMHPATPAELSERQLSVDELRNRLDLREDIALLSGSASVPDPIDLEKLTGWGNQRVTPTSPAVASTAILVSTITVVTALFALAGKTAVPLEVTIVIGQVIAYFRRKANAEAAEDIDASSGRLEILSGLLKRLEQEKFETSALSSLQGSLSRGGALPSVRIAQLVRIVGWRDALRNNLFAPIGYVLLWNTHTALALERWRNQNGALIALWVDSVAEFEALSSVARYSYEHPEYPFAEIVTTGNEGVFEASGLRHPLLLKGVSNNISINSDNRLYLVSGSNMSGKSTLLRTIGINAVLALAGVPVAADRMRVSIVHVGASLRTNDSLQAGVSRFYAEIKRLRQIVDIAKDSPPALFLLDEILHGTNSHDRTVGAAAVLRALLSASAIGLVTTHDLALATICDDRTLHAVNVHFQDEMVDGKMFFDYHLRPGVVEKSNAIPLMRSVGLDV